MQPDSWSTKIEVTTNIETKSFFSTHIHTYIHYFISIKHSRNNYSPLFMHGLIIPCILYMLPYLFPAYYSSPPINGIDLPLPPRHNHPGILFLTTYKCHWFASSSTSQPPDTSQFLHIPFFFRSHETVSSYEIKEWIMEDMWDIKRVL
jgi:hypothetical protein